MLTDAELQGLGAQALNMAKRDIEKGDFNFLLAAYNESDQPRLHRMKQIETLIIERLGEDWLNHERSKDTGFAVLRIAVSLLPPDAVIVVTVANGFRPTPKFFDLSPAKQTYFVGGGHDRQHQAVKEGVMDVCDVLAATVQTAERVCIYQHEIDPRWRLTGAPATRCFPQSEFSGRLKMFGAEEEVPWGRPA
jgi:hypothetical protein